jgi:hypothetical protein
MMREGEQRRKREREGGEKRGVLKRRENGVERR